MGLSVPTDPRRGPIADLRLRILALLALAFGFSTLATPPALAAMLAVTLALAGAFGVTPRALVRALRLPALIVGALVLLLPFASGERVLLALGPLDLRAEGLAAAVTVALRFLCIFSATVALIGSVPAHRLVAALGALGLPAIMADMAMLTLRHLEDFRRDLTRMRVAMRLRGATVLRSDRFRSFGWALASLMLRSHDRSERVYRAMILRGHGAAAAAPPDVAPPSPADRLAFAGLLVGAGLLVALDRLA